MTALATEAPAVVIGLDIHGLAVARALARAGVAVWALESRSELPGWRTRYARVVHATGLNGPGLVEKLLALGPSVATSERAVLFPTSDRMVQAIAENWQRLERWYVTSWSVCRDEIVALQRKDGIEGVAHRAGVLYPETIVVRGEGDLDAVDRINADTLAVKPVRPLSAFKAMRVDSSSEVADLIVRYRDALPFVVQPWLEGSEQPFCAMLLREGEPVRHFCGRKLRAHPPHVGMGSIMGATRCERDLIDAATRFARASGLSGPMAIEFKRDRDGRLWLIEPNVGRSEYCVDLLIQGGFELPVLEYRMATGQPLPAAHCATRYRVWFDTDRDRGAYLRACLAQRTLRPYGARPVFPYRGHRDMGPVMAAFGGYLSAAWRALASRLLRRTHRLRLTVRGSLLELLEDERRVLEAAGARNLFAGPEWFELYEREVARAKGRVEWHCYRDADGGVVAVWPLVRDASTGCLEFMSNYYTPYLVLTGFGGRYRKALWRALARIADEAGRLDLAPLPLSEAERLPIGWRAALLGLVAVRTRWSTNWRQRAESFQGYMRARPSRLRNTLRRKGAALARSHRTRFVVMSDPGEVGRVMDDYFEVYRESWKQAEPNPGFVRALAETAAVQGWLRLGLLYVGDEPVAAQLWLVRQGVAHIYKLAYKERYRHWSVGTQLSAHLIQHVMEHDGVKEFDYLTGDDPYKRDWMDDPRPLYTLRLVSFRSLAGWAYLAGALRNRASRWLKTVRVRLGASVQATHTKTGEMESR